VVKSFESEVKTEGVIDSASGDDGRDECRRGWWDEKSVKESDQDEVGGMKQEVVSLS